MRPRVDVQVVSALIAEAPAVVEEVLAASASLRERRAAGRTVCESELGSHARALGAAVDLHAPGVFRAHVRWVAQLHESAGLPSGSIAACLRAVAGRVGSLRLPPDERYRAAEALEAGVLAAEEARIDAQVELEPAVRAALRGDRAAYLSEVASWRAARGPKGAVLGIAHVQRVAGEAWMRHQATVVEEHRATELAELGLATLLPETLGAPGPRVRGSAILACAPGEFHVTPLHLAAHLLELEGYAVEVLGADTPAVQLAVAAVERKPTLVGIGVSLIDNLPAARESVEMVRHAAPHAWIAVGGFAARAAGAPALGADLLAPEHFDGHVAPVHGGAARGGEEDAVR